MDWFDSNRPITSWVYLVLKIITHNTTNSISGTSLVSLSKCENRVPPSLPKQTIHGYEDERWSAITWKTIILYIGKRSEHPYVASSWYFDDIMRLTETPSHHDIQFLHYTIVLPNTYHFNPFTHRKNVDIGQADSSLLIHSPGILYNEYYHAYYNYTTRRIFLLKKK